jgi:hypothetical protein
MEHKTSVREYHPKIVHHCKVAERHERAVRYVKSKKKRQRHINIARRHRRICANIAHIWGQQCKWNRENQQYVFDKLYGPIDPIDELAIQSWLARAARIGRDVCKARYYDFQNNTDLSNYSYTVENFFDI